MGKIKVTLFLFFVLVICGLWVVLPMLSFENSEKILLNLTLEELQAYIYFLSSGVLSALLIQYIYRLYTSKGKDDTDYEKYSSMALNDGDINSTIEKL
jgi:cbb3-type cytochrome c oxidase CcoQ subunit